MDNVSEEFIFFREKLKKIAQLHIETGSEREVAFMIGCLHSIAHENSIKFRGINERTEK